MGHQLSGKFFLSHLLLFFTLFSCYSVLAQKHSSPFEKFRLHKNLELDHKVVDINSDYHLGYTEQISSTLTPSIIKTLGGGWFILSAKDAAAINSWPQHFTYLVPANNLWKLSNALLHKIEQEPLQYPVILNAWFSSYVSLPAEVKILKAYEGYPLKKILIENLTALHQLLEQTSVISIEEEKTGRKATTEAAVQRYDAATNLVNFAHRIFPGITGRGKVVSIKERRFDTTDADFKNRYFLTTATAQQQDGHATEITTLVGGSGNSGYNGKGVAWQSTLTSASFDNLMPEPPAYYTSNKITVQNHSYGTGIENEYAADAAAYDLLMWKDSSLLHIFSAGNRGNQTPPTGVYSGIAGFNNLTGSFKMSKNSLSVAASDSFYQIEALSSKGPAFDGRIKPELAAFGIDGTSGSAALTSGAALLLQQALHNDLGYHPPAALVKALLIGSAAERDTPGPDFASGYGHLDVYNALALAKKKQYILGTAILGQTTNYTITIPENVRGLKVTLHWTDTAATPGTAKTLVNDLDLTITEPNNQNTWLPWILSSFPHIDSLRQPAVRGEDHLNNTEQVWIPEPTAGAYTIKVAPFQLTTAQQRFALVFDIQTADTLTITYPAAPDPVASGEKTFIRWQQSYAPGEKLAIDYAWLGSSNYLPVATNINAATGYAAWVAPDTNAVVQLRFTIDNNFYFSDSILISKPLTVRPGFICEDSTLLFWQPLKGISRYNVYTIGDTLMQLAGTTSDTLIKLPVSKVAGNIVAVSAVSPLPTILEARSPGINIRLQGVDCYFRAFLAQWNNNVSELSISLGTNYQVDALHIQKIINGSFQTITSISPVNTLTYNYNDAGLTPGAHTYRVMLVLTNGRQIFSEIQTIIQSNANGWWVFPNPVKRGGQLQIINRWSETEDLYLDIFDMHGRKVKTILVPLIDNSISIANLNAGMYFLVFSDGKKRIGQQKLIILP
jgi:hypothetical protein